MADFPFLNQQPTPAERNAMVAAQASRQRCACGEIHADGGGIPQAVIARMKGYLATHPQHQFAVDEEAGIIAVITEEEPGRPGQPKILAVSCDLAALLDAIGAPASVELS